MLISLLLFQPQTTEPVSGNLSGIQLAQGAQGITTYITQSSLQEEQQTQTQPLIAKTTSSQSVTLQTVPGGSVTAIIAPTVSLATGSGQTIHIQPQAVQPQVGVMSSQRNT